MFRGASEGPEVVPHDAKRPPPLGIMVGRILPASYLNLQCVRPRPRKNNVFFVVSREFGAFQYHGDPYKTPRTSQHSIVVMGLRTALSWAHTVAERRQPLEQRVQFFPARVRPLQARKYFCQKIPNNFRPKKKTQSFQKNILFVKDLRLEKVTSAVRETSISRHNGGPIEGL